MHTYVRAIEWKNAKNAKNAKFFFLQSGASAGEPNLSMWHGITTSMPRVDMFTFQKFWNFNYHGLVKFPWHEAGVCSSSKPMWPLKKEWGFSSKQRSGACSFQYFWGDLAGSYQCQSKDTKFRPFFLFSAFNAGYKSSLQEASWSVPPCCVKREISLWRVRTTIVLWCVYECWPLVITCTARWGIAVLSYI